MAALRACEMTEGPRLRPKRDDASRYRGQSQPKVPAVSNA